MIRVVLPTHLRRLANVTRDLELEVPEPMTIGAVLDTIEAKFPMLGGTIRDYKTKERRAFIRFFACGEDLSHVSHDAPLPDDVVNGKEPLRIVGAMAGG